MLKRATILLAMWLLAAPALAAGGSTLTVVVTGFKSPAGAAMISVFGAADGFPYETDKAVAKAKAEIKDGQATAVFANLPPGNYAVAAFHDEDSSGKLERNAFGIPKKGYALSNTPPGFPSFEKSRFVLDVPAKTLRIPLKY